MLPIVILITMALASLAATAPAPIPAPYSLGNSLNLCYNRFGGGALLLRTNCDRPEHRTKFLVRNVNLRSYKGPALAIDNNGSQDLLTVFDKDGMLAAAGAGIEKPTYVKPGDLDVVCIRNFGAVDRGAYSVYRVKEDGACPGPNMVKMELETHDS